MGIINNPSVSMIVGLVERVSDLKNPEDVAQIDDDLGMEKSEFFNIIDDAETLDLVKIVDGNIQLTDFGIKFANSGIQERKKLLAEKIKNIEPFKTAIEILEHKPNKKMNKEKFLEEMKKYFYSIDQDKLFKVIVNWGRYTKLIGYSIDNDEVYIYK
ncbi:MAG: AAA-associated domain-containing protein [Thermoplasmata archaeon]|nr:AAA-associated domain-containing protein [Thermoplasmata archaeon]